MTWSSPTSLATFSLFTDFDQSFQNARWVVRRSTDGTLAVVYSARDPVTRAKGLSLHLLNPTTNTWTSLRLERGSSAYARLFGLGSRDELRSAAMTTDGTDFFVAAERDTGTDKSIVVLRVQWPPVLGATWSLVGETVRVAHCGLPSIDWDTVGRRLLVAFHGTERGVVPVTNTNIYLWSIDPSRSLSTVPELVDAADGSRQLPRSKDMASVSTSEGRVVLAWRTIQQGAARGAPYKGVMAMARGPLDRTSWIGVPRATVAGWPVENTNASDPCALALPDGRGLVGYWRNDPTSSVPEIRVSERGSRALSWSMSGSLAPAFTSLPSLARYHFFAHLERDDCRVIGVWEGRRYDLLTTASNGCYISGSVGSPQWAVPTDAGYFEVPGTGEVNSASSLFPGFCTGGGALHLVWLEQTTLTLQYASGVIR